MTGMAFVAVAFGRTALGIASYRALT